MKKRILITLSLITTFALGFAFKALITKNDDEQSLRRATGIGGVFFKCRDPKKIREWYQTHLGYKYQSVWGPFLNGRAGGQIQQKKVLPSGALLMKKQNTLSLQRKTL